jgi:hypothetical protein
MLTFHAEPTDDSYGYVCDPGETLIGSDDVACLLV